jgi:hypothetical protein
MAIKLSPRELQDANRWFRLVTRGLYYYEKGSVLPQAHDLYLLRPATREQFDVLRHLVSSATTPTLRTFADSEFRYTFASNAQDELSMWLYAFKSIDVAALTLGPSCSPTLKERLARIEWSDASCT